MSTDPNFASDDHKNLIDSDSKVNTEPIGVSSDEFSIKIPSPQNKVQKKMCDQKLGIRGIPKISSTPSTKPIKMNFRTEERNQIRKARLDLKNYNSDNEQKFVFKAKPMPDFTTSKKLSKNEILSKKCLDN